LEIPKLRQGSHFPEWLLERRKRAERALTSVVATYSGSAQTIIIVCTEGAGWCDLDGKP